MADISEASREQSAGIEQVSLAVSQMDEVTQQNAALVEEAAAAAESLEEQAQALAQAVSVFVLNEEVGATATRVHKVEGLDFNGAIIVHRNWKRRLLEFVGGKGETLDPSVVGREDKCALGCWIHGDGLSLQGSPLYGSLKNEHIDFHRCAADVLRQHLGGDSRSARATIVGEFSERSNKIIGLLEALQKEGRRPAALPVHAASRGVPRLAARTAAALPAPVEDEWAEF
jgi:methyl-accepting chemotaxis protein